MASLRLYRDFYCINHTPFSDDSYVLITPVGISANVYIINSTAITETCIVQNETLGKYFVDLNPQLYSFDFIYELKWSVLYNSISPNKILITRFRMVPYNITAPFDIEIVSSRHG